ncbi:hypothetical protein IB277_28980 [Ensifer sp. ENS07]|jgi:hypothetical protein|uniref:hypothetical protein n=1 Tax=Ensifer TaxID=106591 RepID=UPI00071421BD|nr:MULTISPECIES: hypothetical protein [Ensifer]KQX44971.1 hypothetical protein ASD49_07870 [Ensifer sp. Root1298]KQX76813.1 hypothetical protein ASD41_08125 [Ensifer sp. Root1312]KRC17324.1 hypothetical protein ASE29_08765 [Ensifer sp. Root74]KRD62354.1 hypothetical protein ASE71_08835 [Ensifer sp. Root954]MBD9520910.1 hypothetical protein [Ensifer sp. ENS02]
MVELSAKSPLSSPFRKAGACALLLLTLTSLHHAYGAYIYETPWRLHIVQLAVPAAIVIAAALFVGRSRSGTTAGRVATWLAALVVLAFPVAMIGIYEGGWNHVVKNVAYFGFGTDAARSLFPEPVYRLPDSLLFELTGIAQFPLAVITALNTLALLRPPAR